MKLTIIEKENVIESKIVGAFDTAATKTVDMQPLLDNADKKIVFDCSEMEFITSAGLRLLLALSKECLNKGGSIVLKGVAPAVMRVFQVAGFTQFFTFE